MSYNKTMFLLEIKFKNPLEKRSLFLFSICFEHMDALNKFNLEGILNRQKHQRILMCDWQISRVLI